MTDLLNEDEMVERVWRTYLTSGESETERRRRALFKILPGDPRCKSCYAPFHGPGGALVRLLYGKRPSSLNPHLCNVCENFAREHQGGAEIELSLLFADVRGSTAMAEGMSALAYSRLINRFYNTATQILIRSDALIDKIIGDQVAAMYVPGFAGLAHARRALEAGQQILTATGHTNPDGAWIPVGVGVHTGTAFVGSVGSEGGSSDITVLGDAANTAARLASSASEGELLVSEAAYVAAAVDLGKLEIRQLNLKGKREGVRVHVLSATPQVETGLTEGP